MKTKKNKLTNFLKIGVFLFGISLLLWNCEKEEILIEQETNIIQHSQTYQKINAKEIPEIIITLKDKFKFAKTSDFKNKSSQTNIFNLLDLDTIIKIKTLQDDISYSIRLKENKEKIINVVAISKDKTTNYFIYEYNPTSTFLQLYKLGIKNMGEFEGELRIYTIKEYLEKENTKQKTASSPCGGITFDGGNSDPTGNSGNTNTGSSSYDCVISIIPHHVCPYGGTDHDSSVCGPNGTGPGAPYYTVEWDCTLNYTQKTSIKNKSTDPCIGGSTSNNITTPVGINQPTIVPCEENGCETDFINNVLNNVPNLTFEQIQWVSDLDNIRTVFELSEIIDLNNNSIEVKVFAKQAIALEVTLSKQLQVKQTGLIPSELSTCCPDYGDYQNDLIIKEYGIQPVQAAVDGTFNVIVSTISTFKSNEWVGKRVRRIMLEIGMNVPADVTNEHLAAIFKIRKRNGVVIVEYREGILGTMLDFGLNTLDMISFLTPSKGGGAFLASKIGGISITKMTQHLRNISINNVKVDNLVNTLNPKARFELNGTGKYKDVGGHHPLAKKSFESDAFYKYREAFSVPNSKLDAAAGIPNIHSQITGQQNSLYSAFAKNNEVLTLDKMAEIEIKAMTNVGIPEDVATGWVIKALENLKSQGVKVITHIPWNGIN